jgi:hypothetical protein
VKPRSSIDPIWKEEQDGRGGRRSQDREGSTSPLGTGLFPLRDEKSTKQMG